MRKDNAFGKLCKWGIALWTLFCGFGFIYGVVNVARTTTGQLSNAEALGVGIGLAFWAFLWFLPTAGAAVLYFVFGRSDVQGATG